MNHFLALGRQPVLEILYQDKALLAVNKPAGQLFHGYTKGLPAPLVDQIKSEIQPYVGVVHRLDRPVSGVALFARNSKVAGRLGEQFQQRSLDKIYLTLVEGEPDADHAVLEDILEAPPSTDRPSKGPQACLLSYVKLKTHEGWSLLAIKLGTGRRHQIRMQLSRRGWPIVGDRDYGAQRMLAGTEALDARFSPLALHAARLKLQHPMTQAELIIQAPLPWYWPRELFLEAPDIPDSPA
ncbi:MAG TPA: RluA family pseudouridine synthase [Oligoflexus sp.]|uniref:RluA family pseudouridine synthase n=1 Tax=Oligoflexus sp. TaxID=1971216 RepID=UPI002D29EED9|nr:RluA family pseudouridine synthase [Oligoflexus sp.]HYX33273.1 RluA family pseudouridine synthase [Oligoflexus sp.]